MPWLAFALSMTLAAMIHRCLQATAPSNRVISRLRTTAPRMSVAGALLAVACALVLVAINLADLAARGAPGWLHLLVVVATWDAMKFARLAISMASRRALLLCRRAAGATPPRQNVTRVGNDQQTPLVMHGSAEVKPLVGAGAATETLDSTVMRRRFPSLVRS